MSLNLSATIRPHRQTSVIQNSIHNPPICLIKVCVYGGEVAVHKKKHRENTEKARKED